MDLTRFGGHEVKPHSVVHTPGEIEALESPVSHDLQSGGPTLRNIQRLASGRRPCASPGVFWQRSEFARGDIQRPRAGLMETRLCCSGPEASVQVGNLNPASY
jgi:hypothetical protein